MTPQQNGSAAVLPNIREVTNRFRFEERRLAVCFGYKHRESIHVRLEDDGERVYLCVTEREGRDIRDVTMPFADFVASIKFLINSTQGASQ